MHKAVIKAAKRRHFPDNTPYRSLPLEKVSQLAQQFDVPGREVEIAALDSGILPERYARNFKTLTAPEQAALLRSRVCVIGLGGLGGGVVELLCRAGVGTLDLIEGDRFETSNLNRQLFSTEAGTGSPKAAAAVERAQAINSSITVNVQAQFINAGNARQLIRRCDVVIDCLDNLPARFVVEKAAHHINAPMVSAAVAGRSGHVTSIFPGDAGLKTVYGPEADLPEKGVETSLGTFASAVTVLSALQCNETINILLGRKHLLRKRLLLIDLSDYTFEMLELA